MGHGNKGMDPSLFYFHRKLGKQCSAPMGDPGSLGPV